MSVSADQFNFVAGLAMFLIAVIAGLGSLGAGFFTGFILAGPFVAVVAIWPSSADLVAVIPGLAGVAFAGGILSSGAISQMRKEWDPCLRTGQRWPPSWPGSSCSGSCGSPTSSTVGSFSAPSRRSRGVGSWCRTGRGGIGFRRHRCANAGFTRHRRRALRFGYPGRVVGPQAALPRRGRGGVGPCRRNSRLVASRSHSAVIARSTTWQ